MRDGLQQQREGIVKQEEGLAEIIHIVPNTPIKSLGPVLESLASARPSSSSQDAPSADTPSSSACPPTPACPSSSADTSTSVDPPTSACPVTPSEVPIVPGPEGLSADSPHWKPICMYVGGKHKYKCPGQNCGHIMSTINAVKGI